MFVLRCTRYGLHGACMNTFLGHLMAILLSHPQIYYSLSVRYLHVVYLMTLWVTEIM
jgi:hypothetical protein